MGFVLVFAGGAPRRHGRARAPTSTRACCRCASHFDAGAVGRLLLRKGLPFAYAGRDDHAVLPGGRGDAGADARRRARSGWYRAPVLVLEGLTLVPAHPRLRAHPDHGRAARPTRAGGGDRALPPRLEVPAAGGPAHRRLRAARRPSRFVALLFGPTTRRASAASRILLPAAAFMFLSNFGETTLACVNRWGTIVVVSTLCLVVNVALNLALIPRLGFVGAAWATLVTEGAVLSSCRGRAARSTAIASGWAGARLAAGRWRRPRSRRVLWAARGRARCWRRRSLPRAAFAAATFAARRLGRAGEGAGVGNAARRAVRRGLHAARLWSGRRPSFAGLTAEPPVSVVSATRSPRASERKSSFG